VQRVFVLEHVCRLLPSVVETHELERLRRSIAAWQESSAGPLTKEAALRLVDEMTASRRETARYRDAVE
jgi:hypothetical protein